MDDRQSKVHNMSKLIYTEHEQLCRFKAVRMLRYFEGMYLCDMSKVNEIPMNS